MLGPEENHIQVPTFAKRFVGLRIPFLPSPGVTGVLEMGCMISSMIDELRETARQPARHFLLWRLLCSPTLTVTCIVIDVRG